jgi:hypothetical protein
LQQESYSLANATGRYLQIVGYGNSSNGWNSLTEVDIFGIRNDGASGGDTAPPSSPISQAPGLFISSDDLQTARLRIKNKIEPYYSNYLVQKSRANTALNATANPFYMANVSGIRFNWCSEDSDGVDNSLKDAQRKLDKDSDLIRTLALEFALTNNEPYAVKAIEMMKAWAERSTPVNVYDFNPDFNQASIDGMTTGYCSDRPWNFALDVMWQTYGLINFSDAYLLLVHNGYDIGPDDALIRNLIRRYAEAVNSSFHCWTKWADAHPSSSSFTRYRSDNHLSWCLAGLLSAGTALGDENLISYVLNGASYEDSRGGPYKNPSHIGSVIDYAIEANGRIYEELIMRDPPIGYSFFHLWALSLVARIDEIHFGNGVWNMAGSDGGNLFKAYERYAPFVLGQTSSPAPSQDGDMSKHYWHYEIGNSYFNNPLFQEVIADNSRNTFIKQSYGPVNLLTGKALN